ncbi:hypothetical protein SprV_0802481100 [Sparganum proliferum]
MSAFEYTAYQTAVEPVLVCISKLAAAVDYPENISSIQHILSMFIAGILPALFACVLGADVPVLQLLANSNITLPFIGIRKSQSVLHANAVIQERSKSTSCEPGEPGPKASFVSWPADTTFTFLFFGIPRPQSVFLGDVAIRKGSTSHPCEEGEPCYQSLSTREYAVVYGFHNVGKGIIVAYPVDKTKSPSAIIVQKKGDTSAAHKT